MALAAGLLAAACDNYDADIEAVQAAEFAPGSTNAEFANELAGSDGSVEWSAEKVDGREGTVRVIADIERPSSSGRAHEIRFEYLHERGTARVRLDRALVDGREQNLLSGMLNLLLLQLD
ncbi:MAG: hypothetical protein SGJ07_00210 [Rhodospirillaceae bacterium]|nr:hypothetical protein [Rhodospirillaceae bacterium]